MVISVDQGLLRSHTRGATKGKANAVKPNVPTAAHNPSSAPTMPNMPTNHAMQKAAGGGSHIPAQNAGKSLAGPTLFWVIRDVKRTGCLSSLSVSVCTDASPFTYIRFSRLFVLVLVTFTVPHFSSPLSCAPYCC
jgi:hypothetical protein